MANVFGTYHPAVNLGFLCTVILSGMFLLHPVFLAIGLAASFTYAVYLGGKGTLKFCLFFVFPMMLVFTLVNPLVSHQGATILFYLGDNPVTMEALVYGGISGMMLAEILLWFSCWNVIMTSDKVIYLFGKIIPSMSLIFSMVLRFVPRFKGQIQKISQAQKCVGRDVSDGTLRQKLRHGMKILSVMMTWALENSIDTADSMQSRGYGLKGRSTFSIYRFDARDSILTLLMAALIGILILGGIMGKCSAQYYPQLMLASWDWMSLAVYTAYFLLCFLPVILQMKEEIQWRHSQSKI